MPDEVEEGEAVARKRGANKVNAAVETTFLKGTFAFMSY
jgi:hypothetical protein